MRPGSGAVLVLTLFAGLAAAGVARAQDAAPPTCEVPGYLLSTESTLPRVAEAVKNARPLTVLVVGSRSSTILSSEASAYPAKLQAALKEKLPSIPINLSVELQTGKTAEEVDANLLKLVEAKRPTLVIWQTGTVDAMRSVDPDDFRDAVGEGVAALQDAGADVVLVNLQYSPRTETMISAPPYLDNMRVVAQLHSVPLFDRFAIMRHWNDAGDFDLFSTFSWHRHGQTGSWLHRPRAVEICARCGAPRPGAAELGTSVNEPSLPFLFVDIADCLRRRPGAFDARLGASAACPERSATDRPAGGAVRRRQDWEQGRKQD
jgi:hypothetical protein